MKIKITSHHASFIEDFNHAMDSRPTTPTTASDSAMTPSATPEPYANEWHITVKADEHAGAIDALFNCIKAWQSGAEPIGGTCPRSMGNRMTYDVVKKGREARTLETELAAAKAECERLRGLFTVSTIAHSQDIAELARLRAAIDAAKGTTP